jgi:hypothetical protein
MMTYLEVIWLSDNFLLDSSTFMASKFLVDRIMLICYLLCQEPCPSGCICRQQSNWQTEELVLVSLQEIEIQGFGQSDHDIGFVEQLFGWATSLTKATIFFYESVTEGVAKELCWMCQFFSTPKLHIDFRYHNNKKVLCAHEE